MTFFANVRRTIITKYTIDAKDAAEARAKMNDFDVDDEEEIDQVDFEILSVNVATD